MYPVWPKRLPGFAPLGIAARAALGAHFAARNLSRVLELAIDAATLAVFPDEWANLLTAFSYGTALQYQSERYNEQGLFDWEHRVVREYFPSSGRVLVTSAGGGREARALLALGYRVVATECVAPLADLLARSLPPNSSSVAIQAPPDAVPLEYGPYDAAVIGWGAYTHIVGRDRRVEFLRRIRDCLMSDAPVLLSFWEAAVPSPSSRMVAQAANVVRRLTGRRLIEVGESTSTRGWSRSFAKGEVQTEALAASLDVIERPGIGFAHLVLRARAR